MTVHKFLPNSVNSITNTMLKKLGLESVEDLYSDVPDHLRLKRELKLPDALSEIELERLLEKKLQKNKSHPESLNFLGGGITVHHIPAIIDEILSRGEFYTAYTPYQPEISQGMLQGMFEYQSQICELTGMEVANSSMYDWGTALGEAGRMTSRVTKRKKILVSKSASPERLGVLNTYAYPAGIQLEEIPFDSKSGKIDLNSLERKLDDSVAGVYVENPNFLGIIEDDVFQVSEKVHARGSLLVVGVDPATLGVLTPPGEYGADIVVGDGQPVGLYPNFGGPLIGILATKQDQNLLRQMPGRLIGLTTSKDGSRRGYTMVLQTREQHIRREQATSNICTNEALFALAVSIFLSTMGPEGLKELGNRILASSHFASKRLAEEGLQVPYFSGSYFGELSIKTKKVGKEVAKSLAKLDILGGLPLGEFYQELPDISLFAFNESHSEEDIERLISALKQVGK